MTDVPVNPNEPPSGPIDPNNPPTKPPTNPKGRSHDEATKDERADEPEPTADQAAD